jgi:topoisomerase IA-like protein
LLESLEVMRDDYTEPTLSLDDAISYINLPRVVSELNGMPITAGLGPYGAYLKYNNT